MVAPVGEISLDRAGESAEGPGAAAAAAAPAAAARPGRKQQLPLVGMTAYEEAAANGTLPAFQANGQSQDG